MIKKIILLRSIFKLENACKEFGFYLDLRFYTKDNFLTLNFVPKEVRSFQATIWLIHAVFKNQLLKVDMIDIKDHPDYAHNKNNRRKTYKIKIGKIKDNLDKAFYLLSEISLNSL